MTAAEFNMQASQGGILLPDSMGAPQHYHVFGDPVAFV